jgi:hypothetical protein
MRTITRSFAIGTLALTTLLAVADGELRPARAGGQGGTVLAGTGNYTIETVRTTLTLNPPCVSLGTREGTSAFSGLINGPTGTWSSRFLRDACGTVQGTSSGTVILYSATIGGRTGDVQLTYEGIFEGDATTAPGSRTRYQWTLNGLSGQLASARGQGQSVGVSTAPPFTPTATASANYYFEIRLP